MRVNRLISSLLHAPLLMERGTAESLLPVLDQILLGQPVGSLWDLEEEEEVSPLSIVSLSEGKIRMHGSFAEAPEGSVAVIGILGAMMREDNCGTPGTQTLAALTDQAYDHPNIVGLVKLVNSGGGTVDGTEVYARTVGKAPKPVVTFVQGMMASAAYWVGSKANYIMLEGRTSMVGSIGTQISLTDRSAYLEKLGFKQRTFRATESTEKNSDIEEALKGNGGPITEHMLDPLNSVFLSEVREARNLPETKKLNGKMFVGQAAIDEGLADGFGSLEDAIQMVLDLAQGTDPQEISKTQSNTMFGRKPKAAASFPKMTALAALPAAQITDQLVAEANEELEAAGSGIGIITEAQFDAFEQAVADKATLTAANEKLTADLTTMTADRDAYKTKAEEHGQARGADTEDPKPDQADKIDGAAPKAEDAWNSPELSFNKGIDNSRVK